MRLILKVNTWGDFNSEACKRLIFFYWWPLGRRLLACLRIYLLLSIQMQGATLVFQYASTICIYSLQRLLNRAPEADNTHRRPRFSCDARNALLPLMAHGPWVSWNPWNSSCPVRSLDTFGTKFSSFSWL